MNRAFRFLHMVMLSFVVTGTAFSVGCSPKVEKVEEIKILEGNQKIERLNTIATLLISHGFSLGSETGPQIETAQLSSDRQIQVRALLEEYLTLGDEVLVKATEKGVFFSDSAKLKKQMKSAQDLLANILARPTGEGASSAIPGAAAVDAATDGTAGVGVAVDTTVDSKVAREELEAQTKAIAENEEKLKALIIQVREEFLVDLLQDPSLKVDAGLANVEQILKLSQDQISALKEKAIEGVSLVEQMISLQDMMAKNSQLELTAMEQLETTRLENEKYRDVMSENLSLIKKASKRKPSNEDLRPLRWLAQD